MYSRGFSKMVVGIISLIIVAGISIYFFYLPPAKYWYQNPRNFEECKEANRGAIIKTLPAKCQWGEGIFVEGVDREVPPTNSQTTPPNNQTRTIRSVNVIRGSSDVVNGKVIQEDGKIETIDSAGKTTSLTIKDSTFFDISTLISPSGKHLFYGWGPGDGIGGFIYDLETNSHHSIGGVSVVSVKYGYKWLNDGRFEFWRGCVLANQCDHYVSKNSDRPWELERAD